MFFCYGVGSDTLRDTHLILAILSLNSLSDSYGYLILSQQMGIVLRLAVVDAVRLLVIREGKMSDRIF